VTYKDCYIVHCLAPGCYEKLEITEREVWENMRSSPSLEATKNYIVWRVEEWRAK
jgi:hypothetical protein